MARTSTEVVEKQMDAVSLLIEQSKDWRRCRRRWNTKSPQLIRQSELLERELARLLNVQAHLEKEGAELRKKELPDAEISSGRVQVEAERKQLEAQRDDVDCQLEELESAYRDHPFLDACERYAPLTGFGSDEIAAAANAGFDASRLPSETRFDIRGLTSCLRALRADATTSQAGGGPKLMPIHLKYLAVKCLKALRALQAKCPNTRKPAEVIAKEIDQHYHARNIKGAMSDLAKAGLVDSLRHRPPKGTQGGSFITEAGLKRLRDELKKG
ncbi:MAG: hypothetical protein O3C17_17275 [Planctomycetota bacterium]|nr:hypothetical protein [Planctomycetota bacterium]